jgi:hypothetical protein
MMEDIRRDPKDRIRYWNMLMLGNFAEIKAEEDDEKVTTFMNPCGSCGRKVRSGVYEPPMSLAIIKEKHTITFNRGIHSIPDVPCCHARDSPG